MTGGETLGRFYLEEPLQKLMFASKQAARKFTIQGFNVFEEKYAYIGIL